MLKSSAEDALTFAYIWKLGLTLKKLKIFDTLQAIWGLVVFVCMVFTPLPTFYQLYRSVLWLATSTSGTFPSLVLVCLLRDHE